MITTPPKSKPRGEVARQLLAALDPIKDSGSFFAKVAPHHEVNPGLHVDGLDSTIGVPISKSDVQQLIASSRQAPFGKNSETIVDKTVRNTWEIDAHHVQLKGPNWDTAQQKMLEQACIQLGILCEDVKAELYKLLVYEEGAMFKAHQDTEKADGMFGTMVICLPCKHEGGDVVVSFNGQRHVLETSASSEWLCTCLAWYSDVRHEVKPVTSGYRVVLAYNLIYTVQDLAPRADRNLYKRQELRDMLTRWNDANRQQQKAPPHLYYMLEHEYTDAGMRLDRLKGNDRSRVHAVSSLLEDCSYVCYLASIEKIIHGGCDEPEDGPDGRFERGGMIWAGVDKDDEEFDDNHVIVDVYDEKLQTKQIFNVNGECLIEDDVDIEEDEIVQPEWFKDQGPDDKDWSGYTGNEGVTATEWYHASALVIMPKDNAHDYFAGTFPAKELEQYHRDAQEAIAGTKRKLEGDEENMPPSKRSAVTDLMTTP